MIESIDGKEVVVSAPAGEKLFLVSEVNTIYGKKRVIIPFEQMPIEERILKTMKVLGEDISKVAKELVASKKSKAEEVV